MSRRQPLPSLEQLLHLVSRARDGRLLPKEADLLSEALMRGADAQRSAGGLQAALYGARGALKAAEDELAVRRAQRPPVGPLEVTCPRCGSMASKRCIGGEYGRPTRLPHAERIEAAKLGLVADAGAAS